MPMDNDPPSLVTLESGNSLVLGVDEQQRKSDEQVLAVSAATSRPKARFIGCALLVVLVLTVLDLVLFYLRFTTPTIKRMEISLDPEAQVSVSGDMSSSAYSSSFAIKSGLCTYSYSEDLSSPYVPAGILDIAFPSSANNGDQFGAVVALRDSHFPTLRRIYWDVFNSQPANSSLQLGCDVTFTAMIYHAIPVSTTLSLSKVISIRDLQRVKNDDDNSDTGKKSDGPRIMLEPKGVTLHSLQYNILVNLRNKHNRNKPVKLGGQELESFVVHLPKLVFASALVERGSRKQSYLRFRTKALTVDLAQPMDGPLAIDFKISCLPSAYSAEEASEADGDCTLLSPLDFQAFYSELTERRFLNVTATSLHSSFLTSFLGDRHFLRSVNDSAYPGHVLFGDDDHGSSSAGSDERRLVATSVQGSDPSISSGADCVTVDADGVYISQTCAVVENGFFKLYIGVYNDDTYTGYLKSTTSWAPSGPVAFESELEGSLTNSGTEYNVFGDVMFSESFQNLSAVVGFNKSADQLFFEALSANWNFNSDFGDIVFNSLTLVSGVEPYKIYSTFEYGDNAYSGDLYVSNEVNDNSGDVLLVTGDGRYGGDWNAWFVALDESTLSYDNSVIGHANAEARYDVPPSVTTGLLGVRFDVTDGGYQTVTSSNYTVLSWFTNDTWVSDGTVVVQSLYDLYDGQTQMLSWNATGVFQYGDHQWLVYGIENPLEDVYTDDYSVAEEPAARRRLSGYDIETTSPQAIVMAPPSHDEVTQRMYVPQNTLSTSASSSQQVGSGVVSTDQFFIVGVGSYGGDWSSWHADLDGSYLVLDSVVEGYAVGSIEYTGASSAVYGKTEFEALVYNDNFVFETKDTADWSPGATGDWLESGSLGVTSTGILTNSSTNWNASADLSYGQHAYQFSVVENDIGYDNNEFLAFGNGGYGGNWYNWWATLDESQAVIQDSYVGSATGALYYTVPASVTSANIVAQANITDAQHRVFAYIGESVKWSTDSEWTESGSTAFSNLIYIRDVIQGNTSLALAYGDHLYNVLFYMANYDLNPTLNADDDDGASYYDDDSTGPYPENVMVLGNGGYGGNWNNWWATLDYGFLVLNTYALGYSTGAVSYSVPSSGLDGALLFRVNVTDDVHSEQVVVNQQLQWSTNDVWTSQGTVQAVSQLYIITVANWNATGLFNYGANRYTVIATENDYSDWNNEFFVSALGGYGGSWHDWWATLDQSELVVQDSVIGSALGSIQYTGLSNDFNGTFLLSAIAVDSNESLAMNTSQRLTWSTPQTWTSAGNVGLVSRLNVPTVLWYNVTGDFVYAGGNYAIDVQEFDAANGKSMFQDHVRVYGDGRYGGSWSTWFATLDEGKLLYNADLVGSALGRIQGVTPSEWLTGVVSYMSRTFDANESLVLSTDGRTTWDTSSSYTQEGAFSLLSQVRMPGVVGWNASGNFGYGDSQYELVLMEQNYVTGASDDADDDSSALGVSSEGADVLPNFLTYAYGGYGASAWNHAWLSVTNSLVEVQQTVFASVRAYFLIDMDLDMENAVFVANLADYEEADVGVYAAGDMYPVHNSTLWSANTLSWYNEGQLSGGFVETNTSYQSDSVFSLLSYFNLSLVDNSAYFLITETLNGADGVDAWARASYDMESGMIANIGGEVSYADKLLVGVNTAYDMQLENYDNPYAPSAQPTYLPTEVPSVAPTQSPTVVPSFMPTAVPTVTSTAAPTPTFAPSETPSAVPTISPTTAAPTPTSGSAMPSLRPTAAPTVTPSARPSAVPTLQPTTPRVEFSAVQTINGINITQFNSDLTANMNALRASIAQCMTGVTADNVQDLSVTAAAARRRALRGVEEENVHVVEVKFLSLVSPLSVSSSSNAVVANYIIVVNTPNASYSALSTQLADNVAGGNFDTYLSAAVTTYGGTPALAAATSDEVQTVNLIVPTDDSDDGGIAKNPGVLAGIVIGGVVVLVCICGGAYYWLFMRSASSADDTVAGSTAHAVDEKTPSAPATPVKAVAAPAPAPAASAPIMINNPAARSPSVASSPSGGLTPPRVSSMEGSLTTDALARGSNVSASKRASAAVAKGRGSGEDDL